MRFDSARAAGLTEQTAALVDDHFEQHFDGREAAALALTDVLIGNPSSADAELHARLKAQFSDAEIAEIALGVGLFLGMSKVLITLGLEPDSMPTTVVPTPGS